MRNSLMDVLTLDTIFDYFEANGYKGLLDLPEREVTREVYDHFLGILPPGGFTRSSFWVIERITGDIVSSYTLRDGRYFHRYIEVHPDA